jgi:predicted GIY-YIG superfamily endonuclease
MSTTNIYILRLEGRKYYVGKSENVMLRYQQHLNGKGSTWTKKYKPVSLIKMIEKASPFDEDKITKEYMAKYGIENVRGGSYTASNLSEEQESTLKRELRSASDCCFKCGKSGHFAKNCYATKNTSKKILTEESDFEDCKDYDDDNNDNYDDDDDDNNDNYNDDDYDDDYDEEDDYDEDDNDYNDYSNENQYNYESNY